MFLFNTTKQKDEPPFFLEAVQEISLFASLSGQGGGDCERHAPGVTVHPHAPRCLLGLLAMTLERRAPRIGSVGHLPEKKRKKGKKETNTYLSLPLKSRTFRNFLGNMGYMSVRDENFPRAWSFKGYV